MSQAIVTESKLVAIGDAIRSKTGGSSPLTLDQMATEIANISGGGGGSQGDYEVIVYDYDGTIIDQTFLNANDVYNLPSTPSHTGLVFKGWSASETIVNGAITIIDSDVMIGATYTTTSGKNEFDIDLAKAINSKEVSIYAYTGKTIEWGDGLSDTASSDGYISHTYSDYGKYTISYNGNVIYGTSGNRGFINQNGSNINYSLVAMRLAENTTFSGDYVFAYCYSLRYVILPANITDMGSTLYNLFHYCYQLDTVIFPSSTTFISSQIFAYCHNFKHCVIPISVTSISTVAFDKCKTLRKVVIPRNVTSLLGNTCRDCDGLEKAFVSSLSNNIFQNNFGLKKVKITGTITTVSSSAFSSCYCLEEITLPNGVTSISSSAFSNCYSLKKIKFPSTLTTISSSAFQNCYGMEEYDFTSLSNVPSLTSGAFSNINKTTRMYVPDNLYTTWIGTTNWTSYANYIYKASERV